MNPQVRSRARRPQTSSGDGVIGRRHRPDYQLLLYIIMLLAFGLVVIYSVSPALSAQLTGDLSPNHFMYRQVLYLLLGLSVFSITSFVPLDWWAKLQKYIIGSAVVSFFLLFIPGLSLNYGGATRWVQLGPLSYQPAEVLKFGLIFYLAIFLTLKMRQREIETNLTSMPFLVILGLIGLELVVIQKDMGSMIPVAAIMLTMLYLSGISLKRFSMILAVLLCGSILAIVPFKHRRERVFTFLNTSANANGSGYHINQALIGVGSGGLFGKGLGRSVQAYGYLPEAANDSIFAIMAEKFGFVGLMVVFTLYGAFLLRLIGIVARAPNNYLRLVVGGVFAWICVQAFVNVGAMLSIMPLTGVTLPLISFGGTSLIFTLAALGVVFNISRFTQLGHQTNTESAVNEDSSRRRRLGRPRYAA